MSEPSIPTPSLSRLTNMPSLLDKEISSSKSDAFGHRHFAEALRGLVESPLHSPPYSIGLLGKWGTGKSSIKAIYLDDLKDNRLKDATGKIRQDKIHTITFNAWRYGGENIRRALLRQIYCELGGDDVEILDKLFNQLQVPTPVPKSWKAIWWEVYDKWPWMVLQLIAVPTLAILGTSIAVRLFSLADSLAVAAVLAIQVIAGTFLTGTLLDPKRFAISRYTSVTRVELPTASAEQYEQLLVGQLKKFKDKHPKCERIIIFLDDLDRLSSEEMVAGLDAVRALMEIKFEHPHTLGIIFVISCDEERIAEALANKRKQNPDLPGAVQTQHDARRYLDRIFQFRLEIPPFPRQDMRSYAMLRLRDELPQIADSITKHGSSVEEVVSRMMHVGVQSPRNALQILNAFVQAWWVAERREREGAGTDKQGGLGEGVVTKYPVALAALSALHVDFPDFYNDLVQEPQLITRFIDVFARKSPLLEQPEGTRILLEKYAKKPTEGLGGEVTLDPRHRPLRQFLTSVSGVAWPNSLLPLILLSQDPITRRMGDAAIHVYESFVSGDTAGLLADIGRDIDDKPLSSEQIQLLLDLWEDVGRETDDRRDNAASVLSSLTSRLPEKEAPRLLVPLAHRLTDSRELRWRVGVPEMRAIFKFIKPNDQRSIAGHMVTDLLKSDGEVDLRLPQGGIPSLNEAVAAVQDAAEIILRAHEEHTLPSNIEAKLSSWLLVRRVSVGGATQNLPFSMLEQWTTAHENYVINALGLRYAEALINAIDVNDPGIPNEDAIKTRSLAIFKEAYARGQDVRHEVWELLVRYGASRNIAANSVADEMLRQFGATDAECGIVVKAVADRLAVQIEDDFHVSPPANVSISVLKMVVERCSHLSDTSISALAILGGRLGEVPEQETNALGFAQAVIATNSSSAQELLTDWTAHATSNLQDACLDFVVSHYGDLLEEGDRNLLVNALDAIVQANPPTQEQGRRYVKIINGLSESEFLEEPLASHANGAVTRIAAQYANDEYLRLVFPSFPKLIRVGSEPTVGNTIHTLFANTRNSPEISGYLHQQMVGHWPKSTSDLSPYNPDSVFQWASAQATSGPSNSNTPSLLASMQDMLLRQVVSVSNAPLLNNAALAAWPYFPQAAASAIVHSKAALTAVQIAQLSQATAPSKPDNVSALQTIWQNYKDRFEEPSRLDVVRALLEEPAQSSESPDPYLKIWFDIMTADLPDVLNIVLDDDAFNDEQKLRTWIQFADHLSEFGQEQVLDALRTLLVHPSAPRTVRTALDDRLNITALFKSGEERYSLGKTLAEAFVNAPSLEIKNMLIQWLRELNNSAVVNEIKGLNTLSNEDRQILLSAFPEPKRGKGSKN